ncbi:MAG TPA: 3-oxoacyl-[acyl-carrier-protein] reductase [Nitrososphaerales archaeon]|nr:3-oxoacyl-[acyl-carrier-protein] reductase [Nitrososphaerales archaeon]
MAAIVSQESAKDLSGKISLVTGASRGIGAGIAIALAKAGSDVIVNYSKEELAAEEVTSTIVTHGRNATKAKFDVSNFIDANTSINNIAAELGHIDILVNNAGINRDRTLLKMSREEWEEVLSVNLSGVFNVTKAVLPHMIKAGGGRIINMSSIIGVAGNIGQSNYAASKAGIIGFSKSIAKELASKQITVNVIAPSFTATKMVNDLPQEIRDDLLSRIPMRRFANPQEIGDFVAYLASPRAAYITGEVITMSGGLNL